MIVLFRGLVIILLIKLTTCTHRVDAPYHFFLVYTFNSYLYLLFSNILYTLHVSLTTEVVTLQEETHDLPEALPEELPETFEIGNN